MFDRLIVGCGYVGAEAARRWVAAGLSVAALTRSRPDALRDLGVTPVTGDVTRPETLLALPPATATLYAVGLDRAAGHAMRDVYVTGLANVLRRLGDTRVVYVSSTGVYGQAAGEEVDEDSPTEPVEESGKVVLEAERLLRRERPESVVLRFAGIYGPGRLLRRDALLRGEPLVGDADKWLNLIHRDDGADAIAAACERAAPGSTYVVSDGTPVRRRAFYTRLAELLGAPPARFEPPAPGETPPHERGNRRLSNRRARAELGWSSAYSDYEMGLRASM